MKALKIVALVQARLESTRLPRKIARSLLGYPMLYHVCDRLLRVPSLTTVAVITPMRHLPYIRTLLPPGVRALAPRTWEQDLVRRHCYAAAHLRADLVVRVPSDNPCVDPAYVEEALTQYRAAPYVYYSNTTARCGEVCVDGIGAEVCSAARWRWLDTVTKGRDEWREHPHRYFEQAGLLSLPPADLRLDVNTLEDFQFIEAIYTALGHNRFTTDDVLACAVVQARGVQEASHAKSL